MNHLTVTQTLLCALALSLPLVAADDAQVLAAFQKEMPDVAKVHVIQQQPLIVATTGDSLYWEKGQSLGVFAPRGDRVVPITVQANQQSSLHVWVHREDADSITLAMADDYGIRSENLKIFFDPKTYFPIRLLRYNPVQVRHITSVAGVLTVVGTDSRQDYTARERNGKWQVSAGPAARQTPPPPVQSVAQITPMPVSTLGEFVEARPEKARQLAQAGAGKIEEEVGPYQRVGTRIWVGKSFYDAEGDVGVGDIGYYEPGKDWTFLHIREMADWSTSALLVEPDAIWAGLAHRAEGAGNSGGLLRYDRTLHKATIIPLTDVIEKILRVGKRLYCGTTGGFAIIEQDQARRFEFTPQLDGIYTITPLP